MSEKIEMTMDQLMFFAESVAEKTAEKVLTEANLITDTISRKQAMNLYGRAKIEKWIRNGDLQLGKDFFKDGGRSANVTFLKGSLKKLSLRVNLNE